MPSLQVSFISPRTITPPNERMPPKTTERKNCPTPWERNPKGIPVCLLALRSAIRHPLVDSLPGLKRTCQSRETSTSPEGQPSWAGGMKGSEDFIPYTSDIVCGPPPPLRVPGLQPSTLQDRGYENLLVFQDSTTRESQSKLKRASLDRDGGKCVVTGLLDALRRGDADVRECTSTERCHVIPLSVGSFQEEEVKSVGIVLGALMLNYP